LLDRGKALAPERRHKMARFTRSQRAAAAFLVLLLVFVRLHHTNDAHAGHPDVALYSYDGRQSWADFGDMRNLDALDDSRIVSRSFNVKIGTAHSEGLLHRGLWLAVARRRNDGGDEILLLHRSQTMKTCPGAWGLVGEHSNPEEPWRSTAARALREELGLSVADDNPGLLDLAPGKSYQVKVAYLNGRRDLQATGLYFYRIPSDATLHFDEEVAGTRWVPPRELKKLVFCNSEITALAGVVAELIHARGGLL